jgi:hypothetical protein
MTMLIRTIAAVVASTAITTSALAQSASDIRRPAPLVSFKNAPVGKPIGEPVEDAQQQARDLLTGAVKRPATKDHTSPSLGVGEYREPNLDPQEQVRRLISGTPPLSVGATPTMAPTFPGQHDNGRRLQRKPTDVSLARRSMSS